MISPSIKGWRHVALCLTCSAHAYAADVFVTNVADSGAGSLRAAVENATGGEVIRFNPTLANATITLTSGALTITDLELTIDASTLPGGVSISGNNNSRILLISGSSAKVTLSHLTLRSGKVVGQSGGGMFVASGWLRMTDCQVQECESTYNGAGINLGISVDAEIDRCAITGNSTGDLGFGAGIFVGGTQSIKVTNCQISGNSSSFGGGIANSNGSPHVINCTIQGNTGGGIRNDGASAPVIQNSIIWGNTASGGTLASMQLRNGGASQPSVEFSLIEGASGSGSFGDGGRTNWKTGNLDGTSAVPRFVAPVAASLAPSNVADLRLLTISPAINTGSNAFNSALLDRTNLPRIQEITIDLGAFEGRYATFAGLYPLLNPAGDENQNGASNFLEYALGVEPDGQLPASSLPQMTATGNQLFLTTTQRINGLDLQSAWESSTTLGPSSWQPMIPGVNYEIDSTSLLSPEIEKVVFKLVDSDPARFYRQRFSN